MKRLSKHDCHPDKLILNSQLVSLHHLKHNYLRAKWPIMRERIIYYRTI